MLRPMFATALLASSLLAGQVHAQMASKPLTNDDLAARAQDGLDQTTIVSAIHAQSCSSLAAMLPDFARRRRSPLRT